MDSSSIDHLLIHAGVLVSLHRCNFNLLLFVHCIINLYKILHKVLPPQQTVCYKKMNVI